jgi:hypothetical protein
MTQQPTCQERVKEAFISRFEDIEEMQEAGNYEELSNYGLCVDFVEMGTYEDQKREFIRYQLSCGGPQEEFRIYEDGTVEFWFLDWFDGASITLDNEKADLIKDVAMLGMNFRKFKQLKNENI